MVVKNQKTGQVQQVNVSRARLGSVAVDEPARGPESMLPVLKLSLTGTSPLAVRPTGKLAREEFVGTRAIPPVKISLHEGAVEINGKRLNIPVGLSQMTGKEFKRFANIDTENALYVHRDGGMQRVRDKEAIELVHDTQFTHRRELPVIRTAPRYWGS